MIKTNENMYWFNFKTGEHEFVPTPDRFEDYISQDPSAQGLYRVLIQMGRTPVDSATHVLKICAGESVEE